MKEEVNTKSKKSIKKSILTLHKFFTIQEIESSVVNLYTRKLNIQKCRSELLNQLLSSVNHRTLDEISKYFKKEEVELDLLKIGDIFELCLDNDDKKIKGSFYTPRVLVDYIVDKTIMKRATVCDPACGAGAFLVATTKKLAKLSDMTLKKIIEEYIFGIDIMPDAVRRTKIILSLLLLENGEDYKEVNFNIKEADSLNYDWIKNYPEIFHSGGFDSVIGNPPFVRTKNLSFETRKKIQKNWCTVSYGNVDLYIPFIELGINLINKNGILGFVLPRGYINSFAGLKLRQFLQEKKLVKEILDFNHLQLFDGVTTYTCITLFDKTPKTSFDYRLIENYNALININKVHVTKIKFSNLSSKSWRLLDKKDLQNIKKIETLGIPLEKFARIDTGLATLRNDLYVLNNPNSIGRKYYIKEYNGKKFKIEKQITKEVLHAGTAKNTKNFKNDFRVIIFPYKKEGKKYRLISEPILKKKYPQCYYYLLTIKDKLAQRDKGRKRYETWYAYGRNQGLNNHSGRKLLVPTISNSPRFIKTDKKNALVYCGYSIYAKELDLLEKILNSEIMWYYIKRTSKAYNSGYMSLAKNFIKNFSIPHFTKDEKTFILNERDENKINRLLFEKYRLERNYISSKNGFLSL